MTKDMPETALESKLMILSRVTPEFSEILDPEATAFIASLVRRFSSQRDRLLEYRESRQVKINRGELPDFPKEIEGTRNASWKISNIPRDLLDRRVEITGPSGDTKMVINALNSGANVYMTDFEDSQSPTWEQTIQGQINVRDAIRGTISYTSPEGKKYALKEKSATLIVRPRGLQLLEKHVEVDGKAVSAAIFDFGLFVFHNWKELEKKGTAPYLYLPKIESYLEARWWNELIKTTEQELGIKRGTIKVTVLIETILAAFGMDEILYELRDYIVGLNCGRWDYIFSFIKKFRNDPQFVLPNRAEVTMDKAFLSAYVKLLINTCHRRGVFAIGGMSAFIPIKNNEEANRIAFEQVRKDKEREVRAGHDGTWVAHPGLVEVAKEVFDRGMRGPNQLANLCEDVDVSQEDLLDIPVGEITEEGIRTNIQVGIQYLEAWLRGKGSAPLYNLMEDTATAEICRAQLWQWINHKAIMKDGGRVSELLVKSLMKQELEKLAQRIGEQQFHSGQYLLASEIFGRLIAKKDFPEFLTNIAYEHLLSLEKSRPSLFEPNSSS
jgi:malate synthase